MSKEKLVVEVVAAHNLMPKDGQGSSSPFVEVDFENQRLRTQSKYKDLNPVWNEKLVFSVSDPLDLPYRIVEVSIYNEKKSGNSRNFLGKVRISGSSIAKQGEEVVQLYTLEKRSLFSHIRGEISLKLYFTSDDKVGTTVVGEARPAAAAADETTKQAGNKQEVKAQQQQSQQQQQQQEQQQQNPSVQTSALHQQQEQPQQQPSQQQQRQQGKSVEPKFNGVQPVIITPGGGAAGPATAASAAGAGFQSNDYSLKETNPHLGGVALNKDKTSWTYDLVEQMQYLYVRVVKARDLPTTISGSCDPYAEVRVGNYRGVTKHVEKKSNPEWDQVFAFSKDCIQSSTMEIVVKDKSAIGDDILGRICFELSEVPTRVPPDSSLAPQWYRMEDKKGENKVKCEVMLSVWMGTQADEAFSESWHSKAASVHSDGLSTIKSKVYLSPKLWYLRVNVIEAQDLLCSDNGRYPELSVKAQIGNQVLRTMVARNKTNNPFWNEDLMFVVAEPFEDYLMVSVEDRFGPNKEEILGRLLIPLTSIERRMDDRTGISRWFGFDKQGIISPAETEHGKSTSSRFGSRIHLRLCLDGGYHVLDESTLYSSDLRPTARQLWKPHIGVLEIGILSANSLLPMKIKDGRGTTDAYCVAKYGQKWVRTRTVIDSLNPKWNEQYTWEVFDPCTVVTIGVFDNCHLHTGASPEKSGGIRDLRIGKVRIRLSTLETDRVYTHAYPLLVLHSSGVKKMGELHLAVRFSCSSLANMLHAYSWPLLPKMHYLHPLSVNQLENLRYQAMNIVALRLSRAEPPLWKEVVEYMLDLDSHMWSMRKSKANFFRMMSVISGLVAVSRWVEWICSWKRPMVSLLVLLLYTILIIYPEFILPTALLYMFLIGLWRYRLRTRHPPHMDTQLSQAESVYQDELDEEFDTFPTTRSADIVRMRYDRLRSVAGRIQTVVGNLATQGERFQSLLSWRDPRATFIFVTFCLFAAVGFYAVPLKLVVACWGIYVLRPPRFRNRLPSPALNFFRRLPSRADTLL